MIAHDPQFEEAQIPGCETVGFPSFDGIFRGNEADQANIDEFLTSERRPKILVTFGSMFGMRSEKHWSLVKEATRSWSADVLLVGASAESRTRRGKASFWAVGQVPLSPLYGVADSMIHHGGIGTTYGAIRASTPSIVLPLSCDNLFNGRMMEHHSAGRAIIDPDVSQLSEALEWSLQARARERVGRVAENLKSSTSTVVHVADRVIAAAT